MPKKEAISFFEDYERLTDLLMWFTKEVSLKFNVSFAYKDKDNNRVHYHKEYKYDSKYLNKDKVISIKRSLSYFLSIDVYGKENSVMINQRDMVMLKLKLKRIAKWFTEVFHYDEESNTLVIAGDYEPILMYIGTYQSIQFEPVVLQDNTKNEFKEGVRITLNGDYYFDISVDTFFEFYYIIDTMNMYQCAIIIANYLPAEFGNATDVSEFGNYQPRNNRTTVKYKGPVGSNDNSFFNKKK